MSATTLAVFIARCRKVCQPRTHVPDGELLRRFTQQRDADAFAQLLERYAALVWGVCRRVLRRESDCEDAFQATFLALVSRPHAVDTNQPLCAWLHTVAARAARRIGAHSRRLQSSPLAPEPATVGNVADEVSSRELFRMVDEEIERLPISVRAPLILCCLEGRTRDETAELLGCSVAAVKSRLERGRGLLRRRLERRGVQLPAAFLVLGLTSERIRAGLWAMTMQSALHTPTPALTALAEAALPSFSMTGRCKLILAVLLLTAGVAGAIGQILTAKPQPTPAVLLLQASAAAEPKKPDPPPIRTDRHGDPLPDGAIARLGTVRWRHGDFVHALAYSPNGKMIATTGVGRGLVLWDAATGKELRVFSIRGQPFDVAFSPDGKRIATTQRMGGMWDVSSGKLLWEWKNVPSGALALAFAPDGKTLATANNDGAIHLWDSADGKEKRRIDCAQGKRFFVAYAPDGKLIASGGSDGTIRLWDAATGKEVRRITASKKQIGPVAFSPDGKQLAAGGHEERLRLWDVATGKQIRSFGDKQQGFAPIAFSPDGKLLAAGYGDSTFRLWDTASGEEKRHWHAGVGRARSVAFSPDGKTLGTAVLWDGGIRLWDVETGRKRFAIEGHHGPIPLLRFAPDQKTLISAGMDRNVLWWDLPSQTPRRQFAWNTDSFNGIALSPDGNTLAVADDEAHEVWLWDIGTGKSEKLPGKHKGRIQTVAFSPDGRLVASGGNDGEIHFWDVRERKELRQIKVDGAQTFVRWLLFSPDGKTLAGEVTSFGGQATMTTRFWDVASGKERRSPIDRLVGESPSAFSPDGKVLATVNDAPGRSSESLVRLWDFATGKELSRHRGHRIAAKVEFSPDGKLVVSGGGDEEDNSIHVWEAATGRLIRRYEGHHSWIWGVTFAADGLTVASSAGDSTILLWDITGRQQDGKLRPATLSPRQLESCWMALTDADAAKAYDAVWTLAAAPKQSVPFLRKLLTPVPIPDAKLVAQRLAELDSDDFATRQRAAEELSKSGDAIIPALQRALDHKPALEVRRRVQQLLDRARDWTAARLRDHRAIQALEHIGTPPAREVLRALAAGAPDTLRTEGAKAALRRLVKN